MRYQRYNKPCPDGSYYRAKHREMKSNRSDTARDASSSATREMIKKEQELEEFFRDCYQCQPARIKKAYVPPQVHISKVISIDDVTEISLIPLSSKYRTAH